MLLDVLGGNYMTLFHGALWDTILQILRDPIFALIFTAFLTILASRAVRKVIKALLYLGALGTFIWLVTHNQSFAEVCIAIVGVVFKILLVLIGALALILVVAIICILIMFIVSKPSPYRLRKLYYSPWNILSASQKAEGTFSLSEKREVQAELATGHVDAEHALVLLHEKGQRAIKLTNDFLSIFEYFADDIDGDHPFKAFISLLHIYFSGLSAHMLLIREYHKTCNAEIMDLATILPAIFPDADIQILHYMASAKTFLPDKDEWQNLMDDSDTSIPYVLLKLFCLHRNWKEVCTILYKGYCYVTLLEKYKEALYTFNE
jgi:hypothetical protein